eukprot:740531-Pelagomonas_calceolata.AAC.2
MPFTRVVFPSMLGSLKWLPVVAEVRPALSLHNASVPPEFALYLIGNILGTFPPLRTMLQTIILSGSSVSLTLFDCRLASSQLCAAFAVAMKLGWLSDPPEVKAQLLQVRAGKPFTQYPGRCSKGLNYLECAVFQRGSALLAVPGAAAAAAANGDAQAAAAAQGAGVAGAGSMPGG